MEDLPWPEEHSLPASPVLQVHYESIQLNLLDNHPGAKLSHLEYLPPVVILVLVCIVTSVVSQVKHNFNL